MVKFGIVVWKTTELQPYSYDMLKRLAVESERLDFESFWLADHFHAVDPSNPYYECYTTLSAIASETEKIRLGPLVSCISFRVPSLLAKMTATLDVISGGRLEFGLGAGWDVAEYVAYGIPFPPASVRVDQVEEGLQIVKKMWTEREASFEGRYFTVKEALNEPKPVQKPHPPIWLGARGRRMLSLAAKYADGWNVDTAFTPEIYQEKLSILIDHCRVLGRDPKTLKKSISVEIVIGKTQDEVKELVNRCCNHFQIEPEDYMRERIVGTSEKIAEKLRGYVDLGVDLIIGHFVNWYNSKPVEIFSEKVMSEIG